MQASMKVMMQQITVSSIVRFNYKLVVSIKCMCLHLVINNSNHGLGLAMVD
jgi:hypothetical protein